jgi:UDP-N-acetylglucosamine--N-acetylmuramyl-(pentapeptide) pyrophosphoryl-undecaprenol N-acetylglucosamine transferase
MAKTPLLVIAAGGTGGHMFPAEALAREMLDRGWRVRLSTDPRGARYAGGFPEAVERVVLASGSPSQGTVAARLLAPVRIVAGILAAIRVFRNEPPDLVAGFGGYPSIPALSAAWLLRRPSLIHEANAVPGRVNRFFAPRVSALACGFTPSRHPGARWLEVTGNPVRPAIAAFRGGHYRPPSATNQLYVLVTGGSQGAAILERLMPETLAALPEALRQRLTLSVQVREAEAEALRQSCDRFGINAEFAPFFADLPERLAGAQLVVARAGASTVAEIAAIGRPAILIPFAAALDDHQTENARTLVASGGAVMLSEAHLTGPALASQMAGILGDGDRAAAMAAASAAAGSGEAVQRLADLAEAVARTGRER